MSLATEIVKNATAPTSYPHKSRVVFCGNEYVPVGAIKVGQIDFVNDVEGILKATDNHYRLSSYKGSCEYARNIHFGNSIRELLCGKVDFIRDSAYYVNSNDEVFTV